jgi:hypothetical protein
VIRDVLVSHLEPAFAVHQNSLIELGEEVVALDPVLLVNIGWGLTAASVGDPRAGHTFAR